MYWGMYWETIRKDKIRKKQRTEAMRVGDPHTHWQGRNFGGNDRAVVSYILGHTI